MQPRRTVLEQAALDLKAAGKAVTWLHPGCFSVRMGRNATLAVWLDSHKLLMIGNRAETYPTPEIVAAKAEVIELLTRTGMRREIAA